MERCATCGVKVRGGTFYTPTGSLVCASCNNALTGAVIGTMQGDLGTAIALGHTQNGRSAGILGWIRRVLGKRG